MLLGEFRKGINEAEKSLEENYKDDGVCCSIHNSSFSWEVIVRLTDELEELFKPAYKSGYWLGARNKKNLPKRITVLRLLEQYYISEKIYKEL